MTNVTSLYGGPTGEPHPNEACIEALEHWLEMARSGEIVGVALVGRRPDRTAGLSVCGVIGGYSMLGALEMARAELVKVSSDE